MKEFDSLSDLYILQKKNKIPIDTRCKSYLPSAINQF